MSESYVLSCKQISKTFNEVEILSAVNLCLSPGEIIAMFGSSGCGKTTMLQIAGLLVKPDSGSVSICGKYCSNANVDTAYIRKLYIGYIYQFHHLIEDLSVLHNVAVPGVIQGLTWQKSLDKAHEMLKSIGITHLCKKKIRTLSGGEKQRLAVARALAFNPQIVLADEPTGNLDHQNANLVFNLMLELAAKNNTAMLIATHNYDLMSLTHKQIYIDNGRLKNKN